MKILLTAIGKRVQLIEYLKKDCCVIGVDCGDLVPAEKFVDKFYKVPKISHPLYIKSLLKICKEEKVDLLIPLYEKEFINLCNFRNRFEEQGTKLLLSNLDVINTFNNKYSTYEFFINNNIDTPKTYLKDSLPNKLDYPLIIKPIDGMGSSNVFKIKNEKELHFFIEYIEKPIIQECIEGIEYTIDVLCDLNGVVISAVPRERIEVRSGEVSKSRTVKDFPIINDVLDLCSKAKFIGPITIQCIVTKDKKIKFIEVNPRFGGGVPLSFEAGVNYGKYFNLMCNKGKINPIVGDFKEITMLRYDEAVFI
ncbi:ATP-grasp domain-containing protein [Clostridium brassicae]|uniref:ATP-grasp domain-containing protein n=1 Tax=Clostridium brassicae TaxID=2999072 RepID=A0ABT4DEQ3_9CLOT|nr:ATP-grasp domain-containing protein [Clostridium brassicae]MCY6959581.1 ATP-grasp domain-containing protein [Clostridium brassicae]